MQARQRALPSPTRPPLLPFLSHPIPSPNPRPDRHPPPGPHLLPHFHAISPSPNHPVPLSLQVPLTPTQLLLPPTPPLVFLPSPALPPSSPFHPPPALFTPPGPSLPSHTLPSHTPVPTAGRQAQRGPERPGPWLGSSPRPRTGGGGGRGSGGARFGGFL